MKLLQNLKLTHKLLASFIAMLLLSAMGGLFSLRQLDMVNQTGTDLDHRWMPAAHILQDLRYTMQNYRTKVLEHLLLDRADRASTNEKARELLWTQMREGHAAYKPYASTAEEQELLGIVGTDLDQYARHIERVMQFSHADQIEQAGEVLRNDSAPLSEDIDEKLNELLRLNAAGAKAVNLEGDALYASAKWWIAALLVFALALGLILALSIARMVGRPLQEAVKLAQNVAAGDLRNRIQVHSNDETGQLMQALQAMNQSLHQIVGQVRQGTDSIATASSEIAAGNLDLSGRTESQAGALEQAAAAMEQLNATVKHNEANADQANQLASTATRVAQRGGAAVNQVVQTMQEINTSSRKIVDIIGVIDSIAFQTNILALNAAVEAARAGDQGRGFAVVASEVRALAHRSAAAAKEIKQLIDDSVSKVEQGSVQVDQAGQTMEEIVASINRVASIMTEITASSHEQASGIGEVTQAVAQMDQMTQQNAALVEQAAAATASLQTQSTALAELVSVFELQDQPPHKAPSAPKAVRAPAHTGSTPAPRPALAPAAAAPSRLAPRPTPRPAASKALSPAAPAHAGQATAQSAHTAHTAQGEWEAF